MERSLAGRFACFVALAAAAAAALPAGAAHRKAAPAAPATLEQRLLALAKRPPVRRAEAGIYVARVGESKPVVAFNADRPLVLASTTKLFTTAAALDRLGPAYRFRTRLYRDAEIGLDGVLPGHLVVVGGGDPGLSGRWYDDDPLAVFRPWAQSLVKRGLREVREGLVLDVSFFDDAQVHPDWPAEQEARWYQAPVSALSYNDNVVLVRASGGVRPGAPAILGFDPLGPPLLNLISQVVTAQRRTYVGVRREAGSHTVVAAGAVGKNRTWTGDVTVPDPPLYFASALAQVLRENGVTIAAAPSVRTETAPASPRVLLHTHETPILPVLAVCNKRSQSFFAEQILKTLGAEARGKGTWENGRSEVRAFLASLGLDPARYDLADGSGRAHTNRASAAAYGEFLQALATKWSHFEEFRPTMAVSGEGDGTLRHRLQTEATRGKVFAKTGNVSGVSTLCGYVTAQSGQTYVFSILLNGGCTEGRGHAFQDRFLQELATRG
jgi:D-alanyl-D-alanine carboxypeptidase/D-alanyl-D-alanine-endopeptidase (penicillin-binding protein 4)